MTARSSRALIKGCQGPTNTFRLTSPIGDLELTCCPRAVHSLYTANKGVAGVPDPSVAVELKGKLNCEDAACDNTAHGCLRWLGEYFHPELAAFSTPIPPICHLMDLDETSAPFSVRVWRTLLQAVPAGQTVSYARLGALSTGSAACSRAVGGAMRSNPVMLLVPCHRVLKSGGAVGEYSGGGGGVKKWLLEHEMNHFPHD